MEDRSQEFDSPYPVLISRAFLSSFLKSKKPNWILKASGPDKWKLLVIQGATKFFSFFFLASLLFSLLQLWLDTTTDVDNAKATILEIERAQSQVKEYLGYFKLGLGYDFLILFILIALAGLFPILERLNISGKLRHVNKVVKTAVYFLAFSTSFTFFGNAFAANEEGRVGELEFHKLEIVRGNKLLLKKFKDDVTEKVVREALISDLDSISAKLAEIRRNIAVTKEEEEYQGFVAIAPPRFISGLQVSKFEKDHYARYRSPNNSNPPSKPPPNNPNPPSDPLPNAPQSAAERPSNPQEVQQDKDFADFEKKNRQWYDEKQFSKDSVREAETVYEKATQTDEPRDNLYEKYKEPIEKAIKKGYGATAGKLIKSVLEALGLDFALADEFINPVVNDPIEEFITKKAETIFKGSVEKNIEVVNSEYKSSPREFRQILNEKAKVDQVISRLNKELDSQVATSRGLSKVTEAEISAQQSNAASHLKKMESSSRWESIRASFSGRLSNPGDLSQLGSEARPVYRRFLTEWADLKKNQKLNWYLNSKTNLEEQFFEFTKDYAAGKACWGFILQQQDWDGAVGYYTLTRPDSTATGKPYYLLKYYYDSTGKLSIFDSLYDSETNEAVGLLCPH